MLPGLLLFRAFSVAKYLRGKGLWQIRHLRHRGARSRGISREPVRLLVSFPRAAHHGKLVSWNGGRGPSMERCNRRSRIAHQEVRSVGHGGRFVAVTVFLWAVCFGCAGARLTETADGRPLAKPPTLLVYDFAVTPDDLVGDALGADFDPPTPNDPNHAIARQLTEAIVEKLLEKRIRAARAEAAPEVPKDALLLQGQ